MPSLEELELRLNAMAVRVAELEERTDSHIGIDYGAAQQLSPHPSQQIEIAEYGGGVMRLDKNGIEVKSDVALLSALYFLENLSNSPSTTYPRSEVLGLTTAATTRLRNRAVYNASQLEAYVDSYADATSSIVFMHASNGNFAELTIEATSGGDYYVGIVGPLQLDSVTSDTITALADGRLWYRSDTNKFRARINGVTENLATEAYSDAGVTTHVAAADPHTGYVLESLLDAKGDIYAASADNTVAKLTVGANNKVLVAASGEATGLKWAYPNLIGDGTLLTIATGAVTATEGYHTIDTEAAAATDDLDTINGGVRGQILVIRATNAARTVVVKHGTGNIFLAGADCSLDNSLDTLTLVYYGGGWLELARSNNGA